MLNDPSCSATLTQVFVNETAATVRVSAGLTTRHLLDYLARYRSVVPESRGGPGSLGYTLPAFPWYIGAPLREPHERRYMTIPVRGA